MFQSSEDIDKKIEKQQQIYKRIKLLGTGSYGKAYLVNQIKTNQLFVIKQILMNDLSQQQQQNALREAKILEALSHPNVIKFKEVYRTSKMRLNIVMQYADEGELASKISEAKKQSKYFEQAQILDWFTQICLGIKHIHDRKIIHRDLKAQNIFLTSDKIVKIGDFGVSKVLQKTVLNARTVVGSPYYLSPQIIENKPYSFQTDIWSLGALLYEMCALHPPFTANNLQFLALKIVKGAYGQIPSHYSYELKSLIKSMLNTNSSKRPNINKILTSKIISQKISNFLTQSKRIDEFSHTVIHNNHILQNNLVDANQTQKHLHPPPNLLVIQKDLQNKSQIYVSDINFEIECEKKCRPFTPSIAIQRKGPNNFFNNNKRISKKKLLQGQPLTNNLKFDDLIQIKPSAIEQKVKLPKVSTNPLMFDKMPPQTKIKRNDSELINPKNEQKQIQNPNFQKKHIQNNQIFLNNQKQQTKCEQNNAIKFGLDEEANVGKWANTKTLFQNQAKYNSIQDIKQKNTKRQSFFQENNLEQNKIPSEIKENRIEKLQKPQNFSKIVKKSDTSKKINNPAKKSDALKKQTRSKKTPTISKKNSRKQNPMNMEIVSEQMKKKVNQQQQQSKKQSNQQLSSRKNKQSKGGPSRKDSFSGFINQKGSVPASKKPPTLTKQSKSGNKRFEKLTQPPKLLFQNQQEIESTKNQAKIEEQIINQQKSKSSLLKEEEDNKYIHEEFENYENEHTIFQMNQFPQNISHQDNTIGSEQIEEKLSLNLSDSCKPGNKQSINFNKMLGQMENIKNLIAMANGVIETLPIFGDAFKQNNTLELSQPEEQVIRQDDSELQSVIDNQNNTENGDFEQNFSLNEHQIQLNSSKIFSNTPTCTNFALLTNQQHLQTLKMNLEELFGEENIIFIHHFLNQIIEKEGLDFNEKDAQNMIMFQKPQISIILLRKYFRLIVTVVIMEQQQNFTQ